MENEQKIYELGYLLSPLLPEEKLDEEISLLRKAIEDQKGFIMAEARPKMQKLAYLVKKLENAYWGWIKFSVSPESIGVIKNSLEKLKDKVIRFLITETAKETLAPAPVKRLIRKKKEIVSEIKKDANLEEIDKKLEELLGK
jgi:small subunit ribosomal protein S6